LAALVALAAAASVRVGPVRMENLTPLILELRLARAVLVFLAGASLAAAGAVFQGLFRNALADPFVVGVSGGAALGAVAATVLGLELAVGGMGAPVAAAFAGALGAAFLAYRLARVRGRVSVASLLLAGSAIAAFSSAAVSILLLFSNRSWGEVIAWLMGFVNDTAPWDRVIALAPCLALALGIMAFFARDLDLLLLGEEGARQLGVEAERSKLWLLAAGSVAAAGAVATCGIIGFVGLIVPHVLRALVGPRHRALLPASVLGGGLLLLLADLASRALFPSRPLPVGSVTALLGAPFFIYLLRKKAERA
jgi:iron complex transport system permease protein